MHDILTMLDALRRPRLLIQAARIGAAEYRRSTHLPRHLGHGGLPRSGPALLRLMEMENELNDRRLGHEAAYSATDHVDILIAMMGEARLLRAAHPQGLS